MCVLPACDSSVASCAGPFAPGSSNSKLMKNASEQYVGATDLGNDDGDVSKGQGSGPCASAAAGPYTWEAAVLSMRYSSLPSVFLCARSRSM